MHGYYVLFFFFFFFLFSPFLEVITSYCKGSILRGNKNMFGS